MAENFLEFSRQKITKIVFSGNSEKKNLAENWTLTLPFIFKPLFTRSRISLNPLQLNFLEFP
jgi:hypothetical protein